MREWDLIDELLDSQDPDSELDAERVRALHAALTSWNGEQLTRLMELLRRRKKAKWADGLGGAYKKQPNHVYNCYFSNRCFSNTIPRIGGPDALDGCRASLLYWLSYDLQERLLEHLLALPTATVLNAERYAKPEAYARVYRFVHLDRLARTIKSVQHDMKRFATMSEHWLVDDGKHLIAGHADDWPSDFEILAEQTALGFMLAPCAHLINPGNLKSDVLAGGVVRSCLETMLFRRDFASMLKQADDWLNRAQTSKRSADPAPAPGEVMAGSAPELPSPLSEDRATPATWDVALKEHRAAGRLSESESRWITEAYGLLCGPVHAGTMLSTGEILLLARLADHVKERLAS